jgi:hypothetical protein
VDVKRRKLRGREEEGSVFIAREFDWLFEAGADGGSFDGAFDGMRRGVAEFGVDGEAGGGERRIGEMRDRPWRADGDGASSDEIDFAPEAYVLVRRACIPIDPVDAEIFFGRSKGFDCEYISCAGFEEVRYVEVVGAIRAGDSGGVSDAMAVE